MREPKPLVPVAGRPLLEHVLGTVRRSKVGQVVVVLGADADRVRNRVPMDGASVVVNRDYAEGMSGSIRAGIQASDAETDGFLIVLGDQPFVAAETIDALIAAKNRAHAKIVVPTFQGRRGNPVLLDRALSGEVERIRGDVGCRAIFGHHEGDILEVAVDDAGVLIDLDTPEQLVRVRDAMERGRTLDSLVTEGSEAHVHDAGTRVSIPGRVDVLGLALTLRTRNEPFVVATVVRATRPTSGRPGFKAIVRPNREVLGWVGGSCAESVLIRESLAALRDGQPRLLRLSKDAGRHPPEEGVVEYVMECHSGGALEIYIEPHLPKPSLLVVGPSPVADALSSLGQLLGYRVVVVAPGGRADDFPGAERVVTDLGQVPELVDADTFAAVATMGKYDEAALRSLVASPARYIGLVASRRRASVVLEELRQAGLPDPTLGRIRSPAGMDLKAETPEEIALSIMAEITNLCRTSVPREVPMARETRSAPSPGKAVDVVCGMEVDPETPLRVTRDGAVYLFCSEGCRSRFLESPERFTR